MDIKRRTLLQAIAAAGIAGSATCAMAQTESVSRTFVLVHGSWHGGWCWRKVADRLRADGHRVFTPTCTGLGDRKHLMSKEITLDTFVKDTVNVIEAEELTDVVLVGHSFGGSSISGAAAAVPDRIRHLVYLDSIIVEDGKTVFDTLPPDLNNILIKAAAEHDGISIPVEPLATPAGFGVNDPADVAWMKRRLTPMPIGVYSSPLILRGPVGNNLQRTYISCTRDRYVPLDSHKRWVKSQKGWNFVELDTGHDAMLTSPKELTELLIRLSA